MYYIVVRIALLEYSKIHEKAYKFNCYLLLYGIMYIHDYMIEYTKLRLLHLREANMLKGPYPHVYVVCMLIFQAFSL